MMPDRLTDEQLAELKEGCDHATPGPWFSNEYINQYAHAVWNTNGDGIAVPHDQEKHICSPGTMANHEPSAVESHNNMRLIAMARTLLPALIAELQEHRATAHATFATISRLEAMLRAQCNTINPSLQVVRQCARELERLLLTPPSGESRKG